MSPKAASEDKGYTEGKWSGMPNYVCGYCPFSTLDQKLVEKHVAFHKGAGDKPKGEPGLPQDETTTTTKPKSEGGGN